MIYLVLKANANDIYGNGNPHPYKAFKTLENAKKYIHKQFGYAIKKDENGLYRDSYHEYEYKIEKMKLLQ